MTVSSLIARLQRLHVSIHHKQSCRARPGATLKGPVSLTMASDQQYSQLIKSVCVFVCERADKLTPNWIVMEESAALQRRIFIWGSSRQGAAQSISDQW